MVPLRFRRICTSKSSSSELREDHPTYIRIACTTQRCRENGANMLLRCHKHTHTPAFVRCKPNLLSLPLIPCVMPTSPHPLSLRISCVWHSLAEMRPGYAMRVLYTNAMAVGISGDFASAAAHFSHEGGRHEAVAGLRGRRRRKGIRQSARTTAQQFGKCVKARAGRLARHILFRRKQNTFYLIVKH